MGTPERRRGTVVRLPAVIKRLAENGHRLSRRNRAGDRGRSVVLNELRRPGRVREGRRALQQDRITRDRPRALGPRRAAHRDGTIVDDRRLIRKGRRAERIGRHHQRCARCNCHSSLIGGARSVDLAFGQGPRADGQRCAGFVSESVQREKGARSREGVLDLGLDVTVAEQRSATQCRGAATRRGASRRRAARGRIEDDRAVRVDHARTRHVQKDVVHGLVAIGNTGLTGNI